MVAVIAYQSLNSNSSTEHNLDASTAQYFSRKAQRTLRSKYSSNEGALKYPTNTDVDPHVALLGPAELVPVAEDNFMDVKKPKKKRKFSEIESDDDAAFTGAKSRMLGMVQGKSLQIYQSAYRNMGEQCDLIVLGELDSTHADWKSLATSAGKRVKASTQSKACNCFSLHSPSLASKVQFVTDGIGWCAARCNDVLVVFVHVPNGVANKRNDATVFYKKIKKEVLNATGGGVIDVVMGDTNQSSKNFSPDVISEGLDQKFLDAHSSDQITASDTWSRNNVTHKGTNSVDTKKFDVAVYNTSTVANIEVKYFTQLSFASGKAAAYTDHMGMMVKVKKK